jgi:hypothetical protein
MPELVVGESSLTISAISPAVEFGDDLIAK